MKPETILLLQAIGVSVQMINASLATIVHEPAVSLIVAAIAGGYQFYVQHIGNKVEPPKPL